MSPTSKALSKLSITELSLNNSEISIEFDSINENNIPSNCYILFKGFMNTAYKEFY